MNIFRHMDFSLKLWKLQRDLKRSDRQHERIRKVAMLKGVYQSSFDRLNFEWFNDSQELSEMIEELQSEYIIDWAQRLLVPVPQRSQDENEYWIGSNRTGNMRLRLPAAFELRKLVRSEDKERYEVWSRWQGSIIQIVTSAVSVLSLIVAILALNAKK